MRYKLVDLPNVSKEEYEKAHKEIYEMLTILARELRDEKRADKPRIRLVLAK